MPTDVQRQAWPVIAQGDHVLISAPTGNGKTLATFLYGINQFLEGKVELGATRILYVSPPKALNNDIQRNLSNPLEEIKRLFSEAGEFFPDIKIATRSGDTSQSDRRKMLRRPPEILITTPESLNIMLTSLGGRSIFGNLCTVILDEIHSVFDNRRGVLLMSAVERLVDLSGEFQRIGLSATIKPLDIVAEFIGGLQYVPSGDVFRHRDVTVVLDETKNEP